MNERNYLLEYLPSFSNKQILIEAKQEVPDIVNEVLNAHNYFAGDYNLIAAYFENGNVEEIAKSLFDFCKKNIDYKIESEENQTTQSPGAILTIGKGDCKHYAGFIAGNLAALERITGKKIDWFYRFASYKKETEEPAHVFVVVKNAGKEIWIDPVLKYFNSRDIIPKNYIDYTLKNKKMSLKRIAGINENTRLNNSLDELQYYGVLTDDGKINASAYVSAMQTLPPLDQESLSGSLDYLKTSFRNGNKINGIFDVLGEIFGALSGNSNSSQSQAIQNQLTMCQTQLAQANQNKNSFSQYLPLLLIAGVAIFFLTKK